MFNLLVKLRKSFIKTEELPVGLYSVRLSPCLKNWIIRKFYRWKSNMFITDKQYKEELPPCWKAVRQSACGQLKNSERVLEAVNHISTLSQFNTIITGYRICWHTKRTSSLLNQPEAGKNKKYWFIKELGSDIKTPLEFKKIVLIDEEMKVLFKNVS